MQQHNNIIIKLQQLNVKNVQTGKFVLQKAIHLNFTHENLLYLKKDTLTCHVTLIKLCMFMYVCNYVC